MPQLLNVGGVTSIPNYTVDHTVDILLAVIMHIRNTYIYSPDVHNYAQRFLFSGLYWAHRPGAKDLHRP